jgi:glutaredoxin
MLTIFGYDSTIHKCAYCDNAKRLATMKGIPYKFISVAIGKCGDDLEFDNAVIADLLKRLGRESKVGITMPQIFWNDNHLGGFDDFRAVAGQLK